MTKILYMEDDEAVRNVMQEMMEKLGYEVASQINGQEGLVALATYKPDIILTDLMMPIKGGYEFMQEYYADHLIDVRAPVEVLTGYAPQDTLDSVSILGQSIYDYLGLKNSGLNAEPFKPMKKPISFSELKEKLSFLEELLRA